MEHNKVVFESKVSEIFESPEIKAIEIEILNLYYEINRRWEANERNKFAITRLLKIRKKLLDSKFVMDDYSKQLLSEFNEAMKQLKRSSCWPGGTEGQYEDRVVRQEDISMGINPALDYLSMPSSVEIKAGAATEN